MGVKSDGNSTCPRRLPQEALWSYRSWTPHHKLSVFDSLATSRDDWWKCTNNILGGKRKRGREHVKINNHSKHSHTKKHAMFLKRVIIFCVSTQLSKGIILGHHISLAYWITSHELRHGEVAPWVFEGIEGGPTKICPEPSPLSMWGILWNLLWGSTCILKCCRTPSTYFHT